MKSIPNHSNYAVTRDGRVWSKPRRDTFGRKRKGKWLKPGRDNEGYASVVLYTNSRKYSYRVHRLVLETYIGPCPEGLECRHLNGIPDDNRIENLKWGTRSENAFDAVQHGTRVDTRGEKCGGAKLTNEKIRVIRYLHKIAKFSLTDLAWQFDVAISTIGRIISRKTWRHI